MGKTKSEAHCGECGVESPKVKENLGLCGECFKIAMEVSVGVENQDDREEYEEPNHEVQYQASLERQAES